MNGDIFVNNTQGKTNFNNEADNFFISKESELIENVPLEAARRLNDYDYNILREDAYKDITNELFKLEYKITRLEEELIVLDKQIQSARDISDYNTIEYLSSRKKQLKEDLSNLVSIYNDKSLSAKLSGGILSKLKPPVFKFVKAFENFNDTILSKLPGKFSNVPEIRQALTKLENINKSVDELMTMQTPYGETVEKYEQLSKYIAKANTIQAQISKHIH